MSDDEIKNEIRNLLQNVSNTGANIDTIIDALLKTIRQEQTTMPELGRTIRQIAENLSFEEHEKEENLDCRDDEEDQDNVMVFEAEGGLDTSDSDDESVLDDVEASKTEELPVLLFSSNDSLLTSLHKLLPPRALLSLLVADKLFTNEACPPPPHSSESTTELSATELQQNKKERLVETICQYYNTRSEKKLRKALQFSPHTTTTQKESSYLRSLIEYRGQQLYQWFTMPQNQDLTTSSSPSNSLPFEYCLDFVTHVCGNSHNDRAAIDSETILGYEGWDECFLPRLEEVCTSLRMLASSLSSLDNNNNNNYTEEIEELQERSLTAAQLLDRLLTVINVRWLSGIPLAEINDDKRSLEEAVRSEGATDDSRVAFVHKIRAAVCRRNWLPKWALLSPFSNGETGQKPLSQKQTELDEDLSEGAAERQAKQLLLLLISHLHECCLLLPDEKNESSVNNFPVSVTAPFPNHIFKSTILLVCMAMPYITRIWVAWAPEEHWEVLSAVGNTFLCDVGVFAGTVEMTKYNVLLRAAAEQADPSGVWLGMWLASAHIRWLVRSGGMLNVGGKIHNLNNNATDHEEGQVKKSWVQSLQNAREISHEKGNNVVTTWRALIQRCLS